MLLRTQELLDAADIGKLLVRPRWGGLFSVTTSPNPNTYTALGLPRRMLSPVELHHGVKPFKFIH